MTVLVVLSLFAFFVTLDWAVRRHVERRVARREDELLERARRRRVRRQGLGSTSRRFYHPGHTWVRPVGDGLLRVGVDDFAVRLTGAPDSVDLPEPGTVLAAGDVAVCVRSGDRAARLVTPVRGEVVACNESVRGWPWLLDEDPLEHGWLLDLRAPDDGDDLTDLLDLIPEGPAHRSWVADEQVDLFERLSGVAAGRGQAHAPLAADGGGLADDFAAHVPDDDWRRLTHHFFRADTGAPNVMEAPK